MFDLVSPSVVAVLNDDAAVREQEARLAMEEMGVEEHAPKKIVDVSLRKEPMPHGTGFMIDGGLVVTAAHVVLSPELLKITTKKGETVEAELVHIDEVRDVAILKPKKPLAGVPPLKIADENPLPGRQVWALGHTGNGLWALSWGISEGITSGLVDLLGAKLLLFDAPVYPGFSGGPVVMLDSSDRPVVVGVNHAILFTGGLTPVASISSASAAADIRDALAKKPPAMQATLVDYVKKQSSQPRSELFITSHLSVHKDPQLITTAAIAGDERSIEIGTDDIARVPVVAMMFGLKEGKHEISFQIDDPNEKTMQKVTKTVEIQPHERVAFATADFRFDAQVAGHYDIEVKEGAKNIGRGAVWIEDPDSDDEAVNNQHTDQEDEGEPTVDVIVAQYGRDDPFALAGIRANWVEWRYPRRVGFTWFARGSRGWSGTNVAITAFVLDEQGTIVGRGVGCLRPEVRPAETWSCAGAGGTPLVSREGRYDVVFAMNDRPIAVWPMEAMVKTNKGGSALEKWLRDLKKQHNLKKHPKK